MKILIELKDVTKRFDQLILNHLNFVVKEGEYISITGESGCGKSTLMNILGLIESIDEGFYNFCDNQIEKGKNTADLRLYKIGYIFQNYNLIEKLSVYENITLPCLFSDTIIDKAYLNNLLTLLRINMLLHKKTSCLSGGEKQRVAIARALIMNPPIILADEPTGNLDDENANIVFDVFRQIHQKGKTIIVITHDKSKAGLAEKVMYLKEGKLLCL